MTLRLRLVLALVAMTAVGLVLFGFATYTLYSRSEYQRLDQQIAASTPIVERQLRDVAGLQSFDPSGAAGPFGSTSASPATDRTGGPPPIPAERPQVLAPGGTYAQLRDSRGTTLASVSISDATDTPDLPTGKVAGTPRSFTVGPKVGSGDWRVFAAPTDLPRGGQTLVAVPVAGVVGSLNRFALIEVGSAGVLLAVLAAGAWLVLRRGLRPLESMAAEAHTIAEGDLTRRVAPADGRSEIGQLGLALNTMLGEIETTMSERDATERRLRQFLSDASHELRTPLTSIQGFAELSRMGADDDPAQRAVVMRRIEQESARMHTLVEDLLLLARLDETRPVERTAVDLAVLAADACTDAAAVDPTRAITLDAPEPVVILGDADHLRQAIANLVANALAHTPAGTPVDVSARVDGAHAEVSVRDHGAGIDPASIERVFDRFWQADPARVGSSAGLGLAIVAGIAEEHGGTVTAANAAGHDTGRHDAGAVFTLRFPLTPR